jgi:GPI mannosyltransferase 3
MLQFLERQLPGVPVRLCLFLTIVLHLGCAWFSVGYFNPDEHFQILEFANYKLGLSPASDLAWEYSAKSRQTIQPAIAYTVYRTMGKLCGADPFTVAFMLRLLTSIAGWLVAMALCIIGLQWVSLDFSKKALFLFTCFFWFFPFFHCRFSSENCAGIAFFAGLALILWTPLSAGAAQSRQSERTIRYALAGLLVGFSFFFRFQMGIAIIGMCLWMTLVRRSSLRDMLFFVSTFCAACCICIGIDRWFYGSWVLTPVSYFSLLIVKGAVNEAGTSPWWYYFVLLFKVLAPPYSVLMGAAVFVSWCKCPKNPLVWISIPFFLVHSCIGHKELRFLFPLLYAFPSLLVLGVDSLRPPIISRLHRIFVTKTMKTLIILFIVFDAFLLLGYSFKPGKETISIYKWIYAKAAQGPVTIITLDRSPYRPGDFSINFYRSPHVAIIRTQCADSLKRMIKESKGPAMVCLRSSIVPDSLRDASTEWKVECRSIPHWLEPLATNHRLLRVRPWTIYSVRNFPLNRSSIDPSLLRGKKEGGV